MTGAEQLKAFAEFYSINNSYSFSNNFEEITKNYTDTIPGEVSEVDKIRSIIDQKKEQLNKLNSQIDKISPLIGSQIATELRFMVNQCLSTLDSLGERLTDFSNDMSIENWNEVIKKYNNEYLSKAGMLDEVVTKTEKSFVDSIVYATQYNQVTKEDLEEIIRMPFLTEIEKDLVRDALDRIKEMQVEQADTNGNEEEEKTNETVEEEKGEESPELPAVTEPQGTDVATTGAQVAEPVRQTLDQRLDGIQYTQGMVYSDAVSQVRIEYEIEELDKRIVALQEQLSNNPKKKVSFKQAVELQQLINQREMLRELEFNLTRKEKRTEGKLSKTDERVQERREAIEQEQQRQAEAESRLFKFVSARRQQRLQEKMNKLQAKMATMSMQQRRAAMLKFEKANAKLVKAARKDARKQVRQERHQQRVEQLVALRNKVVGEAQAIKRDAERFCRRPEVLQRLQNTDRPLLITGQPAVIYLPESLDMEMEGPALAA